MKINLLADTPSKVNEMLKDYIMMMKKEVARLEHNVVKQFLELLDEHDERRMMLEQMQLNIEKTKTDIERN